MTLRNLGLFSQPMMCWINCRLMTSRPTCTVWLFEPWLWPGGLDVVKSSAAQSI